MNNNLKQAIDFINQEDGLSLSDKISWIEKSYFAAKRKLFNGVYEDLPLNNHLAQFIDELADLEKSMYKLFPKSDLNILNLKNYLWEFDHIYPKLNLSINQLKAKSIWLVQEINTLNNNIQYHEFEYQIHQDYRQFVSSLEMYIENKQEIGFILSKIDDDLNTLRYLLDNEINITNFRILKLNELKEMEINLAIFLKYANIFKDMTEKQVLQEKIEQLLQELNRQ